MSIGNLSKRKGGFGAGYLYNFKGSVNSPAGLPAAPDYGDIYKIILTDKMVIWDGNAWSDLSDLRGEKGDKGDKGDTGEPFQDLGLIEEENISFILDWLFQDGLYQYSVPGDGGTKTTYVIVNGNDTQGGGCRQTFIESDGNIKFRICPYKEEVWREFVPYITGEDLEEKLSEKADRQTEGGGFVGGLDAVSEDSAVSVGKGAKSKNGGFAAGLNAEANAGAGVGMGAKAYNYGGAVGRNAVAGKGFSGGDGALAAQRTHGADRVNCIQLGEGVNNVEKSLQVYEFQLMDGNGKIPEARLPEAATNSNWGGVVSSWAGLPSTPKLGMYCYVSSDIANGEKYTGKASDMFFSVSNEYPSEILPLGPIKFTAPENCIEPYGTSFAEGYVCVYTENGSKIGKLVYNPTGLPDFIRGEELGLTSMDDTVTFYLGYWDGTNFPAKIEKFSAGSMIFWNGTEWCGVASADVADEVSEKADRQTESGGFQAGAATTVGNTGATEGGAIGKNAKETNGGFAGGAGANASYGGVIGKRAAEKNGGGAAGLDTYANAGGAVGSGAVAGSGFSGGKGAKAAPIDESKGTYIDAVQLGTGTNEVPGSLQVYEFQLMDGNGKIPEARLPEAATNSNWGGVVSSWAGLPSTPKLGMYCYVSSDIANGEKYTGKASDMFFSVSNEYPSEILPLGPIKFTAPENCIEPYGTSFAEGYVCVYTENGSKIGKLVYNPTGLPDFIRGEELGLTSMDDTVTFYLGYWDGTNFPAKIEKFSAGSMIFWNGTEWCGVASADVADEVSEKADKIKTNPHGGIYGYPLIVTDHLAGEGPISLKVYGVSDGVGDLVASGDNTGRYAIPITIRGKNLFSTKSITQATTAINGITWTINDDGSITANGTATANSHYNAVKQADAILFPAGDYSFSTTYEHYNQIQFKIITYVDGAATILTQTLGMDSPVFTLTKDSYLSFQCTVGSGKTLDNVTIYPRIEYGKVLTEYEPYGISTEKTVYADAPLTEGESVEITDIVMPESAKLFISANTAVPPAGMELLYYQDMNKLVGEFASGAHPLMGKKILCLGDSIFGMKNTEVSEFFKSITKANVYNCALGGTRMAQHEEGWDNWSMYRLADSIANNDWAIQENGLSHTNVPPFAEERLTFIKTLDFNDIDVITINHGTNDWSGSITPDNDSNPLDTTTYMGALRYSIETILTAYPHLKIVVLSPCWRYWKDSDGNFTNDSNTRTNTLGEALVSYVSKGKEVAESYQLDWVDLYHIGFNKFTASIYFPSTDTTHPNNVGRLEIAKKMSECIRV